MIFAAGSNCAPPPGGDGDARRGPSGAALPARKRSRSFEDERNPATGTSQWDGASKKTPRPRAVVSCPRPREARREAEDCGARLPAQGGEPSPEAEDRGPAPAPDSYYGLLGTLPCQEAPSPICSLPSEVLRHVFAFLPVEDLYSNVSLVCRLWRELVSDPLVRPSVRPARPARGAPALPPEARAGLAQYVPLIGRFSQQWWFPFAPRTVCRPPGGVQAFGSALCVDSLPARSQHVPVFSPHVAFCIPGPDGVFLTLCRVVRPPPHPHRVERAPQVSVRILRLRGFTLLLGKWRRHRLLSLPCVSVAVSTSA